MRRITYSLRTNSVSFVPCEATKTCLKTGTLLAASSPNLESSVSTFLSPRKRQPSFSAVSRKIFRQSSASSLFRGKNNCPAAYSPARGRLNGSVFLKKASGSCSINPAPSLVFRSAPIAQRCSRFPKILTPFSTRACAGFASRLTIKPIPQLS